VAEEWVAGAAHSPDHPADDDEDGRWRGREGDLDEDGVAADATGSALDARGLKNHLNLY